jgi:hypothetical protein
MVTGDAPATAGIVAHAVGLDGAICPPGPIPDRVKPEAFAVFAGVLPEDKYKLVKAFQQSGHVVGMCGDDANDAPALRQAQMGIAVSTATDVAKSAAGMVLTEPGLGGIVAAVKEGRVTFQRADLHAEFDLDILPPLAEGEPLFKSGKEGDSYGVQACAWLTSAGSCFAERPDCAHFSTG